MIHYYLTNGKIRHGYKGTNKLKKSEKDKVCHVWWEGLPRWITIDEYKSGSYQRKPVMPDPPHRVDPPVINQGFPGHPEPHVPDAIRGKPVWRR